MIRNGTEGFEDLDQIREGKIKYYPPSILGLEEIIMPRKGFPIFIGGYKGSGKSEIIMQIMIDWAEIYDWKCALFLSEEGSIGDCLEKLCEKKMKKRITEMSVGEYQASRQWVSNHFWFYDDPNADPTLNKFYHEVEKKEKEKSFVFDVTLVDPYTNLKKEYKGARDQAVEEDLRLCVRNSKKFNRINIITNHVAKQQAWRQGNDRFLPIPMIEDWSNGQAWGRIGFLCYTMFNPDMGIDYGKYGTPENEYEGWLICQKVKPRRTGKIGVKVLYWNTKTESFSKTRPIVQAYNPMINQTNDGFYDDVPF